MFYWISKFQFKMVFEVIKVSFIIVILIHLQAGSYNFLHASTTTKSKKGVTSTHFHNTSSNDNKWYFKSNKISNSESYELNENYDEIMEISTKMDPQKVFMFEKKLLQLFGMNKIPMRNATKKTKNIPKYFTQLYNDNAQVQSKIKTSNLNLPGRFTRTANTVRSFYQSEIVGTSLPGFDAHLRFDLISIPKNEQITGAEIRIPFKWDYDNTMELVGSSKPIQILIHDVVKIPKSTTTLHLQEPITYPLDSKVVKFSQVNSSFWLTFDIFPAVSRWAALNRKKTLGLAIELIGKQGQNLKPRLKRSLELNNSTSSSSEPVPMLLTYSDDGFNPQQILNAKTLSRNYRSFKNRRRRRNHRHKNRKRNLCSRKRMFVDFTDVGWSHWVLAPPGYQAYYCSGECSFPMADLNATNHAVIQALVNSMNPRLVPPCVCVPNKYSSLSLLYTDSSDRIVLKNYNEMIVDSCGCN